jgi:tRNA threonylcarbamoyl adenosine modification protein (Sua5/YciO/YrdC/YwlC family)
MKILHISTATSWRGGERQISLLIEGLKERKDVEQTLLCPKNSALEQFCIKNNINTITIQRKGGISFSWSMRICNIIKTASITHIHAHDSQAHTHSYVASVFCRNKPYIFVSRRVIFPIKKRWFTLLKYKSVNGIICISEAVENVVKKVLPHASTIVIPSAIESKKLKAIKSTIEKDYPVSKNTYKVGYIAALSKEKDHLTYIKTAEKILARNSNFTFFICGEGKEKENISAEIHSRNLSDKIIMTGFITEIESFINQLDLLLFTSTSEGLGSTVLDFFKYKIPVVSTDCGGINEMIIHEKTGLLAPVGDDDMLAQHVFRLVYDKKLKDELVNNAHKVLYEKFDVKNYVDNTYKYYRKHEDITADIKISAIIPTLNEEKNIESAIKSVLFCDEIIVIDSFSTDNTLEVIKKYPRVKIIQRKFDNFSNQKNYAIVQAKHNWILFIDADEQLTEDNQIEIKQALSKNPEIVAFNFKMDYYFLGKLMKFGDFQTKTVYRLFNKNYCKYDGEPVHEQLNINGRTKEFKTPIIHKNNYPINEFIQTQELYAKIKAEELYASDVKVAPFIAKMKIIFRFFKHYFLRFGLLDGKQGFVFAKIQAYGVAKRYELLKALYKMNIEIDQSIKLLSKNKTILYPTDTVWGIGCDATSPKAVAEIFQIKQRSESKSLVILVSSIEMLQKYIPNIPKKAIEIIESSDKPTSIIYDNPQGLATQVVANDNTVAIRVTNDEFCKNLIEKFGKPIVSTSANISGEKTPESFKHISNEIKKQVDNIVNYRQHEDTVQTASSIVKITPDNELIIIRD